jgi:hypothetical protein
LIPEIDNFQILKGVWLTEEMIPIGEGVFEDRPVTGGEKEG